MSKFKKKTDGGIPAISTASLPDIVFMLLFFFMVATVMRENSLKIKNALPVANQVEKLDKKNPVSYIYMGKPSCWLSRNLEQNQEFNSTINLQNFQKLAHLLELKEPL